jgi:hypothetical protein
MGMGQGSFSIEGTFTIGSSPEFPVGTPLDLTISGFIAGGAESFLNQLYRDDNLLWTGSEYGQLPDSCQVFAGETLILNSIGGCNTAAAQQNIYLEVTPEPATLFLLTLGGLFLRRRK